MAKLVYGLVLLVLCCALVVEGAPTKGADYSPCDICQFFVGYVEDYVGQNKSVAFIVNVCNSVCALAPGEMNIACKGFVSAYVPFIIQYLIDTDNPGSPPS
jgi:hypothetical protein